MIEINGKQYPMWSQFVEQKERWIGGVLHDKDNCGGMLDPARETEIVDIELKANGKDSAFFTVIGKDYSCGFDVRYGGVYGDHTDDGSIVFDWGYGWFSIRGKTACPRYKDLNHE